jgi:hypothetical protein
MMMNKLMNSMAFLLCLLLAACMPAPSQMLSHNSTTVTVVDDRQIQIATEMGHGFGYAWYEQTRTDSAQEAQFILRPVQGAGLLCRFEPASGAGIHAIVEAVDSALFMSLYALNEFGERVSEDYALMKHEPEHPISLVLECIDEQATLVVGQGVGSSTTLTIDLDNDQVLRAGRNGYLALTPQTGAITIHQGQSAEK